MTALTFVDTNLLLYYVDQDQPEKQRKSRILVDDLLLSDRGVLSTQVLKEFFVNATRKLGVPVPAARRQMELFGRMRLVRPDLPELLEAVDLHRLHMISFWDALIVRSAIRGGCLRLLSEDLQHGRVYDGLYVENPFL